MQLILKSLIQSDFRGSSHGNFEAVVVASDSGGPLAGTRKRHAGETREPWFQRPHSGSVYFRFGSD
jgi:hypothetical protein